MALLPAVALASWPDGCGQRERKFSSCRATRRHPAAERDDRPIASSRRAREDLRPSPVYGRYIWASKSVGPRRGGVQPSTVVMAAPHRSAAHGGGEGRPLVVPVRRERVRGRHGSWGEARGTAAICLRAALIGAICNPSPLCSLRLAAQDVALSRRKQGFESPRERHPELGRFFLRGHGLDFSPPVHLPQARSR